MILKASFDGRTWTRETNRDYQFLVVAWNEPGSDYVAYRWTSRSDLAARYMREARRHRTDSVIVPARPIEASRGIVEAS